MTTGEQQRKELGAFLRARRSLLDRAQFGLPAAGRGRTTGLRREEISYLSGVSVTWYTWLEQGRDINPSRQVLDAVATALRLTNTEHDYALTLAGFAPSRTAAGSTVATAPAHVQRFLDALDEHPAYAIAPDWGIAGWNSAYEALYPGIAEVAPEDRNLLWLIFTDPYVRALLDDWDITSRRFLAEFRAEAGPRMGDTRYRDLVSRLIDASPEFRERWESHGVGGFESRERVFRHPTLGRLVFEHHQMRPSDQTDVQLVVYTADAEIRERLRGAPASRPHPRPHPHPHPPPFGRRTRTRAEDSGPGLLPNVRSPPGRAGLRRRSAPTHRPVTLVPTAAVPRIRGRGR